MASNEGPEKGDLQYPDPDQFQDPLENYDPKTFRSPLEQALAEETVAAMQHQPYASVSPDTPIGIAVKHLANLQVACLLIEEDGELIGLFTDRDVLDCVALEYEQIKDRPVREIMTSNPVCVYETDLAAAALSVMAVSGFRHVPVLNLDKKVLGIVSPQRVTEFLRGYFQPQSG
jgi:CBS domain-containing protein